MPRLTTLLALCALIAFQPSSYAAGENRKLTLEDGDRVLLIGDVLIERVRAEVQKLLVHSSARRQAHQSLEHESILEGVGGRVGTQAPALKNTLRIMAGAA